MESGMEHWNMVHICTLVSHELLKKDGEIFLLQRKDSVLYLLPRPGCLLSKSHCWSGDEISWGQIEKWKQFSLKLFAFKLRKARFVLSSTLRDQSGVGDLKSTNLRKKSRKRVFAAFLVF